MKLMKKKTLLDRTDNISSRPALKIETTSRAVATVMRALIKLIAPPKNRRATLTQIDGVVSAFLMSFRPGGEGLASDAAGLFAEVTRHWPAPDRPHHQASAEDDV
jgi:hypothetical protein